LSVARLTESAALISRRTLEFIIGATSVGAVSLCVSPSSKQALPLTAT
jgi:hypothetical protein